MKRRGTVTGRLVALVWVIIAAVLLGGCGVGGATSLPATIGHETAPPTATRPVPTATMAMPSMAAMPSMMAMPSATTAPSPVPIATAVPTATPSQSRSVASPTAGTTVEIRIVNFAFDPPSVTVPVGTTVVWRLVEGYHTVVSADFRLNSPILEQVGDSYTYTFTEVGAFDYVCGVHPEMLGVVQVVR